jgi:alpha-glucosidase
VYVRSFADGNGDGVGDLPGLISRLDHLAWLGVDAVWCSPITVSPNCDFGYDVADYLDVDPAFGSLSDLDRLVEEAGRRGIRVLLDLVPNHTSDRHPWFRDPDRKRRYYVWTDRPNNWVSAFGPTAWTFDPDVGRYYLHNFLPQQPDLDWWREEVREEFDRILRFWFDRGVAGFRIDVCAGIVKDRLLRDNPPAAPSDPPWEQRLGQRYVYNGRRPEVHDVLRRWRRIAEGYDPPRLLLGETHVYDPARLAAFYGADDELQLAQNFMFAVAPFAPEALRRAAEAWLSVLPPFAVPVWHASNHDGSRFPTRWCRGDDRRIRLALTALLTLPGACILYQGDEIGMEDVMVPPERLRDPVRPSRDLARTPMPWAPTHNGGFTTGEPWLPLGELARNVAAQRADRGSILHQTRDLIALKKRLRGPYESLPTPPGRWRYRRGDVVVDLDFERGVAVTQDRG